METPDSASLSPAIQIDPTKLQMIAFKDIKEIKTFSCGIPELDEFLQTEEVKEGDAIFVPSNATHGIKNTGNNTLTYLTANQAFGKQREEELWPEKTGRQD